VVTDGLTPLTVLLFLGAIVAGGMLLAAYLYARITKREPLGRLSLRMLLGEAGVYLLLLIVSSATSSSRNLAPGEEKHICEIDCHLAYSVASATSEPLAGGLVRHVVSVKVRFDGETMSSRRSRTATLAPNNRYVALVDDAGNQYPGVAAGLARHLAPGESYTTDIAFEVPMKASGLRLILRNADPETPFIIGHENSLLHRKTTFTLPAL
jgi:hypothetical protein